MKKLTKEQQRQAAVIAAKTGADTCAHKMIDAPKGDHGCATPLLVNLWSIPDFLGWRLCESLALLNSLESSHVSCPTVRCRLSCWS